MAPLRDAEIARELCSCFGLAVRQLRETRQWSQEALAERANLNRSYVGEIERGKTISSLVTMDKLAVALGISMSELLAHCDLLRRLHVTKRLSLAAIAC